MNIFQLFGQQTIVIFERLQLHTTFLQTCCIKISCCGVVSGVNGVVWAVEVDGVVIVATVGAIGGDGSVIIISVVGLAVTAKQQKMLTWSSKLS